MLFSNIYCIGGKHINSAFQKKRAINDTRTIEEKLAILKKYGVNVEVIRPETSKRPDEYGPGLMLGRVPLIERRNS